jgi:hypothetical protein
VISGQLNSDLNWSFMDAESMTWDAAPTRDCAKVGIL